MWITSGTIADVAIIWAKVEDEDISRGFLIETDRPASRAFDVHGKWSCAPPSQRPFHAEVTSRANLLPKTGGLKSPLMCLNQARTASVGAPSAQPCPATTPHSNTPRPAKQFHGQPIAGHQLIQEKLYGWPRRFQRRNCSHCMWAG